MTLIRISRRRAVEGLALAASPFTAWNAHAQGKSSDDDVAAGGGRNLPGSPDDILIGQSTHFTGPVAPTSVGPARGVDIAIAEFNRRGGVGGRNVRMIKMDDAYNAKRCVDNVNTGNVAAVLPILAEKKIPLVGVYTGSPAVRIKPHPYFFTSTASYRDEVVETVRNLVTLQRLRIGLVYQNSPFGQLMLPVVQEVAAEYKAKLVSTQPVDISGKDAGTAAEAMINDKPDAVLVMSFGVSVASTVQAVRKLLGVAVYTVGVGVTGNVIKLLGNDARGLAVTQILPFPWRATTPFMREFTAAMERNHEQSNYEVMLGYLNMRVLLEGLKRLKPKTVTPENIAKAMESLGKFDMGGYPLYFGPDRHHGSKFVETTIVGPTGQYMR